MAGAAWSVGRWLAQAQQPLRLPLAAAVPATPCLHSQAVAVLVAAVPLLLLLLRLRVCCYPHPNRTAASAPVQA
jgi:hypothetical protein